MIRIFFVVLLFSFVLTDTPPIQRCESDAGKAVRSMVTKCKTAGGRYILKRGTQAGIEIEFDVYEDVHNVTASAAGIIGGIPIPYILPNPDGCTSLECPLKKGGPYRYSAYLDVLRIYPPIVVDVKWELKDEKNKVLSCIIIPARIE